MTGKVAKQDITRRNHLGQMVVVVPKGHPIPEGLEVEPEQAEAKKDQERVENKAHEGRPTPKSSRS